MHADTRHALATLVYAGAYLGAPLAMLFGLLEGGLHGAALCLAAALVLPAGHVFASQPRAGLRTRAALFETAFRALLCSSLCCLAVAPLHRSPMALAGLILHRGSLLPTWRQAPVETRQRIRCVFTSASDPRPGQ